MVRAAIEETEGVIPCHPVVIFTLPYTVAKLACLLSMTLLPLHVGAGCLLPATVNSDGMMGGLTNV